MNVFFDVDYTILSVDEVLRPHTRDVFERLVGDGHRVYVWSGMGCRWEVVRHNGLEDLVSGVYEKPTYRHWERLAELGVEVPPDFVVDDHEEVVEAFGGYLVRRFFYGNPLYGNVDDDELTRVYAHICALTSA